MKRQRNIFGFGSKTAAAPARRRSSLTLASASKQAREAGYRGKDFRTWLDSKGLSDRSQGILDRLGDAYRAGMDERQAKDDDIRRERERAASIKHGLKHAREIAKNERLAKKHLPSDSVKGIFGDLFQPNAGGITDRGQRYRAQKNVPEGPKVCGYCGKRGGRLDVEHINGRETDSAPDNLMWACRSCNVKKANVMRKRGLGTKTHQYNPGGAKTLAQWLTAVSVVTPHKDRGQGSLFPLAGNDMAVADAVELIRATPPAKRSQFAREIASRKSQRRSNAGGIFMGVGRPEFTGTTYKGVAITAERGAYIVAGRSFGTLKDAKAFISHNLASLKRANPLPAAAIGAMNDYLGYAVTGAAVSKGARLGSKLMKAATKRNAAAYPVPERRTGPYATKAEAQSAWYDSMPGRNDHAKYVKEGGKWYVVTGGAGRWNSATRSNPAEASARAFEDFHGTPPTELVKVTRKVHTHRHLASAGVLRKLRVDAIDGRGAVGITFYSGKNEKKQTILAFNERRNQLFVEGGDQEVNLKDFGIRAHHELETLGRVLNIEYFTTKTHLGDEGGTAPYVHKFRTVNEDGRHVTVKVARYPDLIYRVLDKQLEFSGGSYEILAEGINQ